MLVFWVTPSASQKRVKNIDEVHWGYLRFYANVEVVQR